MTYLNVEVRGQLSEDSVLFIYQVGSEDGILVIRMVGSIIPRLPAEPSQLGPALTEGYLYM